MGMFDGLLSGQNGAPPWGLLYQSPLLGDSEQAKRANEAAAIGSMGADPWRMPQPSPFGPVPNLTPPTPAPPPPGFGAGAAPFGFHGPGSMQVDASMLAPVSVFEAGARPVPFARGRVTAQPPAGAPTDLALPDRPTAASGASAPSRYVPIGAQADGSIYHMPVFGGAQDGLSGAAPAALPGAGGNASLADGIADRLSKATTGFIGNFHSGPIGALAGGLGALITGRNTDPSSMDAEKMNATARALLAKHVSRSDVLAAQSNPDVMKALIARHYGPNATATPDADAPTRSPARRAPAPGSILNGYRFRGGNPADRNNWEPVR